MDFKSIVLSATILVLSTSVNAVVLNTLNNIDYEWLELTETLGLSRDAVEHRLSDVDDVLFGYEYASRQLFEDLLLSYTTWDGLNGYHGETSVVSGVNSFISDFGSVTFSGNSPTSTFSTVDGYEVQLDGYVQVLGFYGSTNECGDPLVSCTHNGIVYSASDGTPAMAWQSDDEGWDATFYDPTIFLSSSAGLGNHGSYLVRAAVVPIPAAVWLFGSGFIGLISVARRKKI